MGLLTEAVPKDQLEKRVREYIDKYSNGPTVAYANIKQMINQVQYAGYHLVSQQEIEMQALCEMTEDHKEAVYAFLEKRPAKFAGR